MDEIVEKLKEGYITDLSKPSISKFERANILGKFMIKHGFTQGDMCEKFGFKKGTLSGWLKWGKLGETKYKKLRGQGLSESDITAMLKRENTTVEGQFLMLIRTLKEFINKSRIKMDEPLLEEVRQLKNKLEALRFKNGDQQP